MKINIGALLSMKTSGTDKAAKETKVISENLRISAERAESMNKYLGAAGTTAAKRSGAFNDRDGISTKENRGAKGVSGQRGAAGRDFAGLRDASDSTTGIVAAYATAAANMFAITAAFKALADAAKVQQLREGLELVGAQSGVTLSLVSKNLEKVTGYGISAAESMKSVASATAAGFSGKEIERLGGVARGAAVALGRDLSDAMDRLTRGSIKLEPELLDELGIMTRIDDAVTVYANAHNKAKSSLTQTERRQAFLNAVLAEGEQKFGSIAEAVPISPFDKFNASLKNMTTSGIEFMLQVLNPIMDLMAKAPILILVPLAGVLQSIVGKIIPNATAQLVKMGEAARDASMGVQGTLKFKGAREDKILDSLAYAQVTAKNRLGLDVSDDITIKGLKEQNKLVRDKLHTDQELLRVARLTNAENSAAVKTLQNRVDLGRLVTREYESALKLSIQDREHAPVVARKQAKYDLAEGSRVAYARTQNLIASEEGAPLRQAKYFGKGIAAQWAVARTAAYNYKNSVQAANMELGKNMSFVGRAKIAYVQLGFFGSAAMKAITMSVQVLTAALGAIMFWVTAVVGVFMLLDFFKSEKAKALEAYNDKLKQILETSVKVTEESTKFMEKAQFGKAFEAELGNIREINDALKEGVAIRSKSESEFKTKSVNVSKALEGANIEDKDKVLIDTVLARIEKFKTPAEFKKLSAEVLAAAKSGKDFTETWSEDLNKLAVIEKSWTGIADSAKQGGDAVRKFYGAEAFKTDYSDIANQLKETTQQLANQQETITNPKAYREATKSSVEELMKGGREYFIEMDRLLDNGTDKYVKLFEYIKFYQGEILKLQGKTDQASLNKVATYTDKIMNTAAIVAKGFQVDAIGAKAQIESLKIRTKEVTLEVAKSAVQLQEVQNANRTLTATIARSEAAIRRSKLLNGQDQSNVFGLIDAIDVARVNLQNTKDIIGLKQASLDAEYALLEAQKQFELLKLTNAHNDRVAAYAAVQRTAVNGKIAYANTSYGSRAAALAEQAELQAQKTLLDLMRDQLGNSLGVRDAQKEALNLELRKADVELRAAKEALRLFTESDKRRLDAAAARLAIEAKLLDISLRASERGLELERLKATNAAAAARGNFGAGIAKDTDLKLSILEAENAKEAARKREEQRVKEAAQARSAVAATISGYQKTLADKDTAQSAKPALTLELEKAQKELWGMIAVEITTSKGYTQEQAILVEKLAGLNLDLSRLDLANTIRNRFTEAFDNLALQKATAFDNAGGWGAEMQAGLQAEVGKEAYGGNMSKLLADEKTVGRIRESAQELAKLNLIAESTAKISAAFGAELTGAFTSIIDGSKDAGEAFADMALSMLKMIAELIAQLLAMQAIKAMGSAFGFPPIAGAAGGIIPMATGGIMNRSAGGLQSVITKPTFLVGEGRYNEAVVPLPNGRAIPVQMHGANNSSNNVQVNVHMGQNGETKTESKGPDMNSLGAAIAAAVQKELHIQKAPGGILSRYGAA